MKKTIVLLVLIFLSCSKDNPLRLEETGTLVLNGRFFLPVLTGKMDVPECSEEIPTTIIYRLIDSEGGIINGSSSIKIQENNFTVDTPIVLQAGLYTMDEIYLKSSDNTITHAVPNVVDSRWPFAEYVDSPLPFALSIIPDGTVVELVEALCFTAKIPEYFGGFAYNGSFVELLTMAVWVREQACLDEMGIEINGRDEIRVPVEPGTIYSVPVPEESENWVNMYYQGVLKESRFVMALESEEFDDIKDIIAFITPCD